MANSVVWFHPHVWHLPLCFSNRYLRMYDAYLPTFPLDPLTSLFFQLVMLRSLMNCEPQLFEQYLWRESLQRFPQTMHFCFFPLATLVAFAAHDESQYFLSIVSYTVPFLTSILLLQYLQILGWASYRSNARFLFVIAPLRDPSLPILVASSVVCITMRPIGVD